MNGLARRSALIASALAIAALALRPQLSAALVVRGDEFQYRGNLSRAQVMYARALLLDRNSVEAADRSAFSALLAHDEVAERDAVAVLRAFPRTASGSLTLLVDLALCEHALKQYGAASRDFELAGRQTNDPRLLFFAALDRRTVDHVAAQRLLREAGRRAPWFLPAQRDIALGNRW